MGSIAQIDIAIVIKNDFIYPVSLDLPIEIQNAMISEMEYVLYYIEKKAQKHYKNNIKQNVKMTYNWIDWLYMCVFSRILYKLENVLQENIENPNNILDTKEACQFILTKLKKEIQNLSQKSIQQSSAILQFY